MKTISIILIAVMSFFIFRISCWFSVKEYLIGREKVLINGVYQNLFHYGRKKDAPVMLVIHGGPGFPESPLFLKYNRDLLENYHVVFWEQRGSGVLWKESPDKDLTLSTIVHDACLVSRHLVQAHSCKKITLLCHSWGTIVGLKAVQSSPDLFNGYIGISQKSSLIESERVIYTETIKKAKRQNEKLHRALQKLGNNSASGYDFKSKEGRMTVRKASISLGGGIYSEKSYLPYLVPYLLSYEYGSFTGIYSLVRGILKSVDNLLDDMNSIDLTDPTHSRKVAVPVLILQGEHDLQTPHSEANRLFNLLTSPQKSFVTFNNSSHNPHFEEPQKANETIIDFVSSLETR